MICSFKLLFLYQKKWYTILPFLSHVARALLLLWNFPVVLNPLFSQKSSRQKGPWKKEIFGNGGDKHKRPCTHVCLFLIDLVQTFKINWLLEVDFFGLFFLLSLCFPGTCWLMLVTCACDLTILFISSLNLSNYLGGEYLTTKCDLTRLVSCGGMRYWTWYVTSPQLNVEQNRI